MKTRVYLALPPNIMRRARETIRARWPGVEIGIPDIHSEMFTFASSFGHLGQTGELPALTVTAYPQMALHAGKLARQGLLDLPGRTLPPLREEFAALGLTPPVPHLRVVAVVPGVLAASAGLARPLNDWADLCAPDFPGLIGCPPADTPMPYLLRAVLGGLYGASARGLFNRLDTSSNPIDINKRIAQNELSAAVIIPGFARAFRGGSGRMIWPASGALAIPLSACLAAGASVAAHEILAFLLSEEFQGSMLRDGALAPVISGITGFAELEERNWKLYWPGWELFLRVAEDMLQVSMPVAKRRARTAHC